MELVRTKFAPPHSAAVIVPRPRLLDMRRKIATRRLTLVRAPAGYGKTTLLAGWHDCLIANQHRVAWLTLDARERTASGLLASIEGALTAAGHVGFAETAQEAARKNIDDRVAILIDKLSAVPGELVLLLDQVASIDAPMGFVLHDLLRYLPVNVHIVIASRGHLNIPTATLRAYGDVLDIGADDLAFTLDEAAELCAVVRSAASSAADLATIHTQTEGWVTGLRAEIDAPAASKRMIAAFFAENVMRPLESDEQQFLRETSILERPNTTLCEALTARRGALAKLRHLEDAGAFVRLSDDGDACHTHPMFSAYLRSELIEAGPETFAALHARAAQLFTERGDFAAALHHASQSGDHDLLASILERSAEAMTYHGKLTTFATYAAQLPEAKLAQCPWTLLSVAWLKLRGLQVHEGLRLLSMARAFVGKAKQHDYAGDDELNVLDLILEHREMILAAAQDDAARVETLCDALIRRFAGTRPFIASTLYGQLIAARRERFRFDDLERLHARGCVTAEQSGYRFALVALHSAAGLSFWATGRGEAAINVLNKGLAEAFHWAGRNSGLAALVALPLADIAYDHNDLAEASAYLDSYMPVARELCFVDQLIAGHIVASRLQAAADDLAGAERALDEAARVAFECELERLSLAVLHERVRLLIRNGQAEAAVRMTAQAGPNCLRPSTGATTSDELRALIATRILISQNQSTQALSAIRHWRAFCQQRGAVRSVLRWNLLMAQALALNGEALAAQRIMREAIAAAVPMNALRSFVDEGQTVLAILADAYVDAPPTQHPSDVFARSVLDAFGWKAPAADVPGDTVEALGGKLSAKEIEILTLVDYGMRNREIGNRLGLTEGSVKWYMQQVYDKVGIRRRSQAVERARRLGLMP